MAFSDDFERPDSATLGPNWDQVAGQFQVVGGTAHAPGAGVSEAIALTPEVSVATDATATIAQDSDGFSYASIVCLGEGTTAAFSGYRFGYSRQFGRPILFKYLGEPTQGGSVTQWNGNPMAHPGNPYDLRLVVVGNSVIGTIDGATVLNIEDPGTPPSGGRGGLWSSHGGEYFESFGIAAVSGGTGGWSLAGGRI